MSNKAENAIAVLVWSVILVIVLSVLATPFWLWPKYRVWQQAMSGKAKLREAEWSRQVLIQEAEAQRQSEILRAEGVAEANAIIADSLAGRTEYLTYLWVQGLHDGHSEVIYVPTEANLPVLEAGRFGHRD